MGIDYLIFGNVDSRDYGIEVFFKDVDRTPKRVYQRIEVPGRNGAFLIDEKRYEDVPVSYDCIALLDADRKAFVNALAAQAGYKRLQDSFNDDEFYSASFDGDVDPNVTKDRAQSTFSINFTRSAQRNLLSGETELTLQSGDTLTNPTLFDSSPLLAVEGYGTIAFNGYEIELDNAVLGDIVLYGGETYRTKYDTKQITINTTNLNTGDEIFVNSDLTASEALTNTSGSHSKYIFNSVTSSTNVISAYCTKTSSSRMEFFIVPDLSEGFAYGTSSIITSSATYSYRSAGSQTNYAETISMSVAYDGDDTITITTTRTGTLPTDLKRADFYSVSVPRIYGHSTQSLLGDPTYIDCDLGEAYRIDGETITSLNQHIDLGSDLPKLASGANEITYDNTITELNITPRWWRV